MYWVFELAIQVTNGNGTITYPRSYFHHHPHWDDAQTYSYNHLIEITENTGTVSFTLSEFERLFRATNMSIIRLY